MNLATFVRTAPLAGLVFTVLFVVGTLIAYTAFGFAYPIEAADAKEAFEDSVWTVRIGVWIIAISSFSLIGHGAYMHSALRDAPDRVLTLTAAGGAAAAAALLLVYAGLIAGGADRGSADGGISEIAAALAYDSAGAILGVAWPAALAAHVLGVTFTWFRMGGAGWPTWWLWVSVLFGIGLLSPLSWAVMMGVVIWFPVVSIVMYRRQQAAG